jgi:hypothetical protein
MANVKKTNKRIYSKRQETAAVGGIGQTGRPKKGVGEPTSCGAPMSQFVYTKSMQPNTETRRCHRGRSSSRAEKKRKVKAGTKSTNRKAQSKRREAASVLLSKAGAEGVGTLVFFVVGFAWPFHFITAGRRFHKSHFITPGQRFHKSHFITSG